MKYRVIGARPVAGVQPGGVVDLDLPEPNIAALLAAKHIAPFPTPKPKKVTDGDARTH